MEDAASDADRLGIRILAKTKLLRKPYDSAPPSPPPTIDLSYTDRGLKALHEGDGRPFVEEPVNPAISSENRSPSATSTPAITPATTAAAAAATTPTGVSGGQDGDGNPGVGVTASVAAELKTLTAQVERLEATLDRVLAALEEREAGVARGVVEPTVLEET